MGTGSFPEVKWPGRSVDHPPHLAPRWPVIGWALPFTFIIIKKFLHINH